MKHAAILDDDPTVLLVLSRHLSRLGYEVTACRELEGAETLLEHFKFDVLIADLCVSDFGDLEGGRLLSRVSRLYPSTRLIAISARVDDRSRELCSRLGCPTLLEKPLDLEVLARLLGKAEEPGPVRVLPPLDDFLAAGALHSALQPIVSLAGDAPPWAIHGIECLARVDGDTPLRNPEILFAYAARKDRLFETDLLCLRSGLAEAARFGGGGRVFLNVEPRSVTDPTFAHRVEALVSSAGFANDAVVFELTEHPTSLVPSAYADALSELRRRGFRIALDDYGTGASNLQSVLDLAPDYLKISGILARGLDADPRRQAAVGLTATLASRLGMVTILECVETEAERDAARELGVDFAQGWYYGRPTSAQALLRSGKFGAAVLEAHVPGGKR
jgi:EAL domain-containing protein (putative c-di-GMP-specific phosphodiesterase class I)